MKRVSFWFVVGATLLALPLGCDDGGGGGGGDGSGELYDGCPDDLVWFERTVQGPVLSTCAACHNDGGIARGTRFRLVRIGDDPDALKQNLQMLRDAAQWEDDAGPLLLQKPTNLHPDGHGGGEVLDEDGLDALTTFHAWATGGLDDCDSVTNAPADCDAPTIPGDRLLRRITHSQYDRTIEALLGVPSTYGERLASDDVIRGYANQAEAQRVAPLLAEQYRVAAEELSEVAVTTRLDSLLPCDPEEGAACAVRFVEEFGRRAFRRSLERDEVERYYLIWRDTRLGEGFGAGIRWVITAILQSPHFLYRAELGRRAGDVFELTDHELATALAYLVTDAPPSDALLTAADEGELSAPSGVLDALTELLADPRAESLQAAFIRDWLHLERLPVVPRDAEAFPDLTPELRAEMAGETERLLRELARRDASLDELLTADYTFLTPELAAHYDVALGDGERDEEGFVRSALSGTPYAGLLTHGSVMVTHALPASSSPIHRGVLVRERFLCDSLPPPPANLDTSPPPVDPTKSTRERYAAHSALSACAGCHQRIDPIGFGFEHFDGDGRYRDEDAGEPVDASGEVVLTETSDGPFDGVAGLAEQMLGGEDFSSCFAEQWFVWASGVDSDELSCAAQNLGAQRGELSLSAPLQALVTSTHFRTRRGGDDELDAPGSGVIEPYEPEEPPVDPPIDPPGPDGIEFSVTENSRWPTGYCVNARVSNTGDAPVDWAVEHEIEGTIDSLWNAESTSTSGATTFTGVGFNRTVAPGGTAEFGWCASL